MASPCSWGEDRQLVAVCYRVRNKSLSLHFGMDSGKLQKGDISCSLSECGTFFRQKNPSQIWQDKAAPARSPTWGKRAIAGCLMVIRAWMMLRSRSAKGAESQLLQNSCYWKMTPDLGRAFYEMKSSWISIMDPERSALYAAQLQLVLLAWD